MAHTNNGEKIYSYFANEAGTLEFASDWMDFFTQLGLGNQMYDWHKWCDEFAVWVLDYNQFEEGAFNLIREEEK